MLFISTCLLIISGVIFATDRLENYRNIEQAQVWQAIFAPSANPKWPLQGIYLIAGGDIMLSRNIGYYNKREGYDRIFWSWKYNPIIDFQSCTSENCLLFFNLESPFHPKDNDIQMWGFTFRANTGNIEVLRQLRNPETHPAWDTSQSLPLVVSLANNHLVNGWYVWLDTTMDLLHWYGIGYVWAGILPEEAGQIYQIIIGNIHICLQAYSYEGRENLRVWWGLITRNPLNEAQMKTDLEEMKKIWCDMKILAPHRGREYKIDPTKAQIQLAHNLIDSGADLILGWHSHIPSKIEKYNGKYIFYSLGNFIFDQEWWKTASGREFDYIYDYKLQRKTVPTYIAMMAGFQLIKQWSGVQIILDDLHFDTVSKGIHEKLDEETSKSLRELLLDA